MIADILAAIVDPLGCGRDWLRVSVALHAYTNWRHVAVHDGAIPAQVATPEVRAQSILRDGLIARLADKVFWVPFPQ